MDDQLLKQRRITSKTSHAKNKNKNLVAERAIHKVESELLCDNPDP